MGRLAVVEVCEYRDSVVNYTVDCLQGQGMAMDLSSRMTAVLLSEVSCTLVFRKRPRWLLGQRAGRNQVQGLVCSYSGIEVSFNWYVKFSDGVDGSCNIKLFNLNIASVGISSGRSEYMEGSE